MKNCTFSIILPVLHESDNINSLIKHIHDQQTYENYEIIVVEGNQNRETINAIKCKDVIVLLSKPGRALQMNAGAAAARGEILLFLHADTLIPSRALHQIRQALRDSQYVGGSFDLAIRSDKLSLKLIAKVASLRSRLTRIPYGDQVIFLRKDYFNRLGGYKNIPLMEDVELMQRIKRRGDKICILTDKVITSPRRWEKEGIIFCTLRNWIILTLYMIGISPSKLVKYYKNT